jgi:DNA-binding LacI/PurR family transcriptional regulator
MISIDDINVARLITPALSTVHINREELLQDGIDMLLAMIKGKSVSSKKLSVPELQIRETTKGIIPTQQA